MSSLWRTFIYFAALSNQIAQAAHTAVSGLIYDIYTVHQSTLYISFNTLYRLRNSLVQMFMKRVLKLRYIANSCSLCSPLSVSFFYSFPFALCVLNLFYVLFSLLVLLVCFVCACLPACLCCYCVFCFD